MNIIGIILMSGVAAAIYWTVLYNDGSEIKDQIKNTEQQIISHEKKLAEKKEKLQSVIQFDSSVKLLSKELNIFLNYIPQELTTRILFQDVIDTAEKSRMNIKNITNMKDKKDNELYKTLTVRLNLEGNFSNFLIFLSYLTKLDKIIIVDNVQMRPISSGSREKNEKNQRISVDMNLYGFSYVEPSATQDKESPDKKQT